MQLQAAKKETEMQEYREFENLSDKGNARNLETEQMQLHSASFKTEAQT